MIVGSVIAWAIKPCLIKPSHKRYHYCIEEEWAEHGTLGNAVFLIGRKGKRCIGHVPWLFWSGGSF